MGVVLNLVSPLVVALGKCLILVTPLVMSINLQLTQPIEEFKFFFVKIIKFWIGIASTMILCILFTKKAKNVFLKRFLGYL